MQVRKNWHLTRDNVFYAKPFLKWAGGKQQLIPQYQNFFPIEFGDYYEPFLGSGAVYFHLFNTSSLKNHSYLSDNNVELINTYVVVRDNLDELMVLLKIHQASHNKEYYYEIRGLDRNDNIKLSDVEKAARMIYLNRTCFNGLYRVNSKGYFNVPIGRYKNPKILFEDVLRTASDALQDANIKVQDFKYILSSPHKGDLIYFDPPYHPLSETSSFTSYTSGNFTDEDQRELANVFSQLSAKGCLCMLSNSYSDLILTLYKDFKIHIIQANRAINSKAHGRGKIKEVLVTNY
ncbi:MAG: DNA adenine methylase [Deltaproteobacteria bacterium]